LLRGAVLEWTFSKTLSTLATKFLKLGILAALVGKREAINREEYTGQTKNNSEDPVPTYE